MEREQREYPRATSPFSCQYRLLGEFTELWRTAAVLDVSAGGFRFTCQELLEEGARIEVHLILPIRKEPLRLFGHIIWAKASATTLKEYGGMFLDVTPEKQVELDKLVQFLLKAKTET